MTKILLKRGNVINLPEHADEGELLVTLDTNELYLGKGTSLPLTKLSTSEPGTLPSRYICATGIANTAAARIFGFGTDATIDMTTTTATINSNTTTIISCSIYFAAITATTLYINLPTGFGMDKNNLYFPQIVCYRATAGSRAPSGTINMNTAINQFSITGLVNANDYVVNISF